MFWSLVRPDRILLPITRSAAVTTSLEADELAVDMISCESAQNPGVRPSDQLGAAPFQTHTRGGALGHSRRRPGARGDGRKFLSPPNPESGGASLDLVPKS